MYLVVIPSFPIGKTLESNYHSVMHVVPLQGRAKSQSAFIGEVLLAAERKGLRIMKT